jgi:Ca2+-transporting ATPase
MNAEEKWHTLEISEALERVKTSAHGLTQKEAEGRIKQYGLNELASAEDISPLTIFFRQFKSILILILVGATIISIFTGHTVDAAVILVIVLVSVVLGFTQEYRAERALEALKKMLRPTAVEIKKKH